MSLQFQKKRQRKELPEASPEDRLWLAIMLRSKELQHASKAHIRQKLVKAGVPRYLVSSYLRGI